MKKLILLCLMLICICNISFSQVSVINVNPSDKKQTVTAMGAYLDPNMIDDLIFDIGCGILRIIPGSFDGYIDEPINDNGNPDSLDLTKFVGMSGIKLIAVQKAVKNGVKILATVGSPPNWMKDTNSTQMYWRRLQAAGKPAAEYMVFRYRYDCGGILRSDLYPEFGEFAAGVVKIFKQQTGVDLFAYIPQNEPEFAEPYGSCVYTGPQMVEATKAVGDKFIVHGVTTTKIGFADQTFVQGNVYPWAVLANNDSSCKKYISAFSNHDYSDDPMGGGMAYPFHWAQIYREANRVLPYKETWMDEGGPGYSDVKTVLELSIGGASEFHKALRYGRATVFMMHSFSKNDPIRYGAIKNMVRFIRPGSYRITAVPATDTLNILPVVFKHDGYGSTTIVITNVAKTDKKTLISGLSGKFDMFRTSDRYTCNWIGQQDLADTISLPAMSITTLVYASSNKLPTIDPVDTLVLLKNSGLKSFDLSGITDGGEGGQKISLAAWAVAQSQPLFTSISTTYTSPNGTGKLNLTPISDITGMTYINLAVRDNSKSMDSMYNEKVLSIPTYVIPFVNRAPTMSDIPDQTFTKDQIGSLQLLTLTGISDGNDGSQTLTLVAVSSGPGIVAVIPQGSKVLKLTPLAEGTITITVTLSDNGVNAGGGKGSITKLFKVIVGSGINSTKEFSERVSVYPNPAHDQVTIDGKGVSLKRAIVMSLDGKTIMDQIITDESSIISLKNIPAGVYMVKIYGEQGYCIRKLIIE